MTTMTVSGHTFDLDPKRVEKAVRGELPAPIYEHFVVINGRRWPPKQVLALVTGGDLTPRRWDACWTPARSAPA